MQNTYASSANPHRTGLRTWFKNNRRVLLSLVVLLLLPFIIALVEGQSLSTVLNNEAGTAKFFQGLLIESLAPGS